MPLNALWNLQIVDALTLLLPSSPLYTALSALPPPDPTAPTATTTLPVQAAVHNALPIFVEIVALTETDEDAALAAEVERRRMRLDAAAAGPEAVRREVGRAIWGESKVGVVPHPKAPFIYLLMDLNTQIYGTHV